MSVAEPVPACITIFDADDRHTIAPIVSRTFRIFNLSLLVRRATSSRMRSLIVLTLTDRWG